MDSVIWIWIVAQALTARASDAARDQVILELLLRSACYLLYFRLHGLLQELHLRIQYINSSLYKEVQVPHSLQAYSLAGLCEQLPKL